MRLEHVGEKGGTRFSARLRNLMTNVCFKRSTIPKTWFLTCARISPLSMTPSAGLYGLCVKCPVHAITHHNMEQYLTTSDHDSTSHHLRKKATSLVLHSMTHFFRPPFVFCPSQYDAKRNFAPMDPVSCFSATPETTVPALSRSQQHLSPPQKHGGCVTSFLLSPLYTHLTHVPVVCPLHSTTPSERPPWTPAWPRC